MVGFYRRDDELTLKGWLLANVENVPTRSAGVEKESDRLAVERQSSVGNEKVTGILSKSLHLYRSSSGFGSNSSFSDC
jgi:hypothetical protein